uniref:Secreted protein n=1 Tax=Hordeum vulgare subsp. vulgare TaxID=112509 RepID=A0A8I6YCC5_HORVV
MWICERPASLSRGLVWWLWHSTSLVDNGGSCVPIHGHVPWLGRGALMEQWNPERVKSEPATSGLTPPCVRGRPPARKHSWSPVISHDPCLPVVSPMLARRPAETVSTFSWLLLLH